MPDASKRRAPSVRLGLLGLGTVLGLLGAAAPASADLTAFVGVSPSPSTRPGWGAALGAGLLVVGFEFEYCRLEEDSLEAVPSVKTGMGNLLVQTPISIHGWQLYGTIGGGVYRERLGDLTETSFAGNLGGGAKVTLSGAFRLRFDYRMFTLRGDPIPGSALAAGDHEHGRVHRFYAGLNLNF
jgi:hypothetical protein